MRMKGVGGDIKIVHQEGDKGGNLFVKQKDRSLNFSGKGFLENCALVGKRTSIVEETRYMGGGLILKTTLGERERLNRGSIKIKRG